MNVGIELRNTRLRQGLSLDAVSKATKIKVPVLQALEDGDVGALPPIVYVLGYLRAYAREVGLEANDIVPRYMDYLEEEKARTEAQTARCAVSRMQAPVIVAPVGEPALEPHPQEHQSGEHQSRARLGVLGRVLRSSRLMAAAAVLLAIFTYVAFVPGMKSPDSQPVSEAIQASGTRPQVGAVGGARDAAAASVGAVSNPASAPPFRIAITPTQSVWVSASADGQSVVSRQMEPGERAVIDVQGSLVLRVSDPARVTWSIDGRPGRSLGTSGQTVTVQITRDTLEKFLSG